MKTSWNEADRIRLKIITALQMETKDKAILARNARVFIAYHKHGKKLSKIAKEQSRSVTTVKGIIDKYERYSRYYLGRLWKNKIQVPKLRNDLLKSFVPHKFQCPICRKPFKWITWAVNTESSEKADDNIKIVTTTQIRESRFSCLCLRPGHLEAAEKKKEEKLNKLLREQAVQKQIEKYSRWYKIIRSEYNVFCTKIMKKYATPEDPTGARTIHGLPAYQVRKMRKRDQEWCHALGRMAKKIEDLRAGVGN